LNIYDEQVLDKAHEIRQALLDTIQSFLSPDGTDIDLVGRAMIMATSEILTRAIAPLAHSGEIDVDDILDQMRRMIGECESDYAAFAEIRLQ